MIPTIDERLGSVVRALSDVVLPSLPPEAGLAAEQIQLAIGHVQIVRAQIDAAPAYEMEELADAVAIGTALKGLTGGEQTQAAIAALATATTAASSVTAPADVRAARNAIHDAVTSLVGAISHDGDNASRTEVRKIIIEREQSRVLKDRKWFAPFGFDSVAA